jgi:hypothetical protein
MVLTTGRPCRFSQPIFTPLSSSWLANDAAPSPPIWLRQLRTAKRPVETCVADPKRCGGAAGTIMSVSRSTPRSSGCFQPLGPRNLIGMWVADGCPTAPSRWSRLDHLPPVVQKLPRLTVIALDIDPAGPVGRLNTAMHIASNAEGDGARSCPGSVRVWTPDVGRRWDVEAGGVRNPLAQLAGERDEARRRFSHLRRA